ncbi:hypothetical protein ACJIZ3_007325 [Penstemon smallii]|uniref:Uncharacterized protein n=1 Tax=Penstemon smallii TaxID=265156 RepID=A0ABD3SA80_9LAMI
MIASVVDEIKKVRLKAKKPTWFCTFVLLGLLKAFVNTVPSKIPAKSLAQDQYFFKRRINAFCHVYSEFEHIDMPGAEAESSPEVGSSSKITAGSCTNSTPIDTLRFSPPEIPLVDSLPILSLAMCSNPSSFNKSRTLLVAFSRPTCNLRRALHVVYEYMASRRPTWDNHPGQDFEQCGFSGPTWASNCSEFSWHGVASYVIQYTLGGSIRAKVTKVGSLDR